MPQCRRIKNNVFILSPFALRIKLLMCIYEYKQDRKRKRKEQEHLSYSTSKNANDKTIDVMEATQNP